MSASFNASFAARVMSAWLRPAADDAMRPHAVGLAAVRRRQRRAGERSCVASVLSRIDQRAQFHGELAVADSGFMRGNLQGNGEEALLIAFQV